MVNKLFQEKAVRKPRNWKIKVISPEQLEKRLKGFIQETPSSRKIKSEMDKTNTVSVLYDPREGLHVTEISRDMVQNNRLVICG